MKFSKFPSIEQFRTVVKNVIYSNAYNGKDDDGNSIYDYNKEKPKIKFTGTVKLHGTNAGVAYDGKTFHAQKRGGICTVEKDNAGFAFFVETRKEIFKKLLEAIPIPDGGYAVIYGEWCGGNIQKGVGINGLDKMFIIFDTKVIYADESIQYLGNARLDISEFPYRFINKNNIFITTQFPNFEEIIDFANPELSQERFIEITNAIEKECPVAKYFGVDGGVGEGIVWRGVRANGDVLRFKVKGEKHSTSKVKKMASVDVEKIQNIKKFADYAVTDNRMNQAMEQVFTSNNIEPSRKGTGDLLRWVINDIMKEEMDTMVENHLEPKDANKYISEVARKWFFNKLDESYNKLIEGVPHDKKES